MPSGYLLDTNVLSDLLRQPSGGIARQIAAVGESRICTSIVVAGELRFGAAKSGSARLGERVESLLQLLQVHALADDADLHYGRIRDELGRQGTPIGPNDLWIAAHALALDMVLVTDNVREFTRIPGLPLENWRS
ncbi:MAG: type II toxin-antitoxin system VapC family toxin [Lysobacteraceae bacterium]